MKPRIQLGVSLDTEEDNWDPTREHARVENIQAIPEHQRFLADLGLRPTYFVNHAVVADARAASVIAHLADTSGVEIAAHLHPWNTPPLTETFEARNTMLMNLPRSLQYEKICTVRDRLHAVTGEAPTVFRAGRFGLGAESLGAIHDAGFLIDSSVTPAISWRECDDGPEFWNAPNRCYRVTPDADPTVEAEDGAICEVPLSTGFTRAPFEWRERALRRMKSAPLRSLPLVRIASKLRILRHVIGSPEISSLEDLVAMSRCLVATGATHLLLVWHTPTLMPGLNPFVKSDSDRKQFDSKIEKYVRAVEEFAEIEPATVGEIAARFSSERQAAAA